MSDRNDFLAPLGPDELHELILRLLLYSHHRYGPRAQSLVFRAFEAALNGESREPDELDEPHLTPFARLARILDALA